MRPFDKETKVSYVFFEIEFIGFLSRKIVYILIEMEQVFETL